MNFILGCNYWASNAGADMWRDFDADVIAKDIALLAEYGVKHLRIFPNWRDFQPVIPLMQNMGTVIDYCLEGDRPAQNEYYLEPVMLERFAYLLDVCKKHNIQTVVGLITGWMSGRLYIPALLNGRNIITDPLAQYFEQLFIKGFVASFKDHPAVYAWDLGNECNCMADASRIEAVNWTAMISNAIRAIDPSRPIVSGMHGLTVGRSRDNEKAWQIKDQAMFTDMLTTHPYPYFCAHTRNDETLSLRTTMHATAQTKYYAEIGKVPCMAEEIGTLGPMVCSNENAAHFLRLNMFSLWANGASGVMWWCANDQDMLTNYPYSEKKIEQELGMLFSDHTPKPVLKELKAFSAFLDSLDFELPKAQTDAVCLLTHDQDQWGVGYMTHILLRQAGFNASFAFADDPLPDSDLYLMPSIAGATVLHQTKYEALKAQIREGADLYLSMNSGILSGFEAFTGMRVVDSYDFPGQSTVTMDDIQLQISKTRHYILESVGGKVLAYDSNNHPAVSAHQYGKGHVYLVNFPLEAGLISRHNGFEGQEHQIYRKLFASYIDRQPIIVHNTNLALTCHYAEDVLYAVVINHSDKVQLLKSDIHFPYKEMLLLYGSADEVQPFDACVIKFTLQ